MFADHRLPSPEEESRYLQPTATIPKYFHFAMVICERYCNSPVGTILPPLTELASRFSVSKETINRSMRYLASRGYVKAERGRGTRIIRDFGDALGLPSPEPGAVLLPENNAPLFTSSGSLHPSRGTVGVQSIGVVFKRIPHAISQIGRHLPEIEILGGLQHRLLQENVPLTTIVLDEQSEFTLEKQIAANPSLGGLVFMTGVADRTSAELAARLKLPAVSLNSEDFSDVLTCITACEAEGMEALIRYLYRLGHRQLVYLAAKEMELDIPRFKGFEAALNAPDLDGLSGATHILGYERKDGELIEFVNRSAESILAAHPEGTAFVSGGSEAPFGFCQGLRRIGIIPGREISVASFGIGLHEWNSIAYGHDQLTTVAKPRYEMGCYAADLLISRLKQKYGQTGVIRLPTNVVKGTTTGPVYRSGIMPTRSAEDAPIPEKTKKKPRRKA